MDSKQLRSVLARNVQRLMDASGKTQEVVEAAGGLGQATVSRVLTQGGDATLRTIAGLAEALDCQPWELLIDDETTREAFLRKYLRP